MSLIDKIRGIKDDYNMFSALEFRFGIFLDTMDEKYS